MRKNEYKGLSEETRLQILKRAFTDAKFVAGKLILQRNDGTGENLGELLTDGSLEAGLAAKLDATEVGSPGGVAALDESSKLLEENVPSRLSQSNLNNAFARRGNPKVEAPLLVATPLDVTATTMAVYSQDPATGLYYGSSTANGHYQTSPDLVTWTDQTYSPSVYTPGVIGFEFDATNMYAYSNDGRLWRAAKGVFNAWTEITVPDKGPLTTGRPGSLCALGNGVLLYGNYTSGDGDGSHIWRSTDAGTTWTHVLDKPAGKHVHAIRKSPNTGEVWATLGDAGFDGAGLWKSTDDGATWTQMASNDYGIDMVFAAAEGRLPDRIIMEGDGLNRPHLMGFDEDAPPGSDIYPLVWFTGAPASATSTRGTARGIGKTPDGDVVFFTTTEAGAVGSRAGLWVAQAPDYTRAILLKETTGAEPSAYMATMTTATTARNYLWQFTTPTFGSY